MKFTEMDYEYLRGKDFSNGYKLKLQCNPLYARTELVKNLVSSVRGGVLHVGCCDHLPLIDAKVKNKTWMHGVLDSVCERVIGTDINEAAVNYVNRKKYSKNPVYCAEITNSNFFDVVPKENYEAVFLGEILEHVDNPAAFLSDMKNTLKEVNFKGTYIITVPNAFSFLRDGTSRKGIENINSDHRYWFTPYTIAKVMIRAGITPEEILFCNYGHAGNGSSAFTRKLFAAMYYVTRKPFPYKSWRGDQMIAIGK